MKPSPNQGCEICGAVGFQLFDARVKQSKYGNRGHWVFMCETCHKEWGLGTEEENLVVYQKFFWQYREVRWWSITNFSMNYVCNELDLTR
jgi:uncharacterized protein YlaI